MIYTNQKSKGKTKFRSSEQAKKSRDNQESWNKLLEKYDVIPNKKRSNKPTGVLSSNPNYRRTVFDDAKSLDSGVGIAAKPADKVYTGDAIIGISVLHKSNGVPVFRDEDIKDISKMRRG
jgi:hypothetical protein